MSYHVKFGSSASKMYVVADPSLLGRAWVNGELGNLRISGQQKTRVRTTHFIMKRPQRITAQWRTTRLSHSQPADYRPYAAAAAVRPWAELQCDNIPGRPKKPGPLCFMACNFRNIDKS